MYVFDENNVNIEFSGPYGKSDFYKKYGEKNIKDINVTQLRNKSLVSMGQGIKYSGTVVKQTSSIFATTTQGASTPGIIFWESLWWGGFAMESYGNHQLNKSHKIWQGLLLKGATIVGGEVWKNRKTIFKTK